LRYKAPLTDTCSVDFVGTLSKNIDLAEGSTIKDTLNRLAVRAYFGLNGRVRCNQVREVGGSAAPAPKPKVSMFPPIRAPRTRRQTYIASVPLSHPLSEQPLGPYWLSAASSPKTPTSCSVPLSGKPPLFFNKTVPLAATSRMLSR
jgi:hypothetical protein